MKTLILMVLIFSFQKLNAQTADQLIRINSVANATDMQNITSPHEGSLVYVESLNNLFLYDGTQWNTIWTNQGNMATDSCFIGPKSNHDFRIRTNNAQRMVVKNDGKVGVNIVNPSGAFQVNTANVTTLSDDFIVATNGNVGVGINPTQKLHVNGNILATGTITPDYVFEKYFEGKSELNPNYEFHSLEKVEDFIKEHKHLPGVPSAQEVEKQGGIIVNRATEINLEKIEELYLHILEFSKKNEELNQQFDALEKKYTLLKSQAK